jgi:hypothetical protein
VVVAMLAGCVIGAAVFWFTRPVAAVLLGRDAAAAIYLLWVWDAVRRLDAGQTGRLAAREALTSAATDLVALGAGTSGGPATGLEFRARERVLVRHAYGA